MALIGYDDIKGMDWNIQFLRIFFKSGSPLVLWDFAFPTEEINSHPLYRADINKRVGCLR